jgi:predicted hydrolase (HD superfamily)
MTRVLGRQAFGDPANKGNVLAKDEAQSLLESWVPNIKLRNHMYQVGYLLKCWASEVEELTEAEQWKWQMTGWLHDADWDQWPEMHCQKIIEELENRNIDPDVIHAIASHGPLHFGVEPQSKLDKVLYAFDELSGFVHAYSLMRPEGYRGMEVKGVQKRLKDKTFAAQVSREDIADGALRLSMNVENLIAFVIRHQAQTPEFIQTT